MNQSDMNSHNKDINTCLLFFSVLLECPMRLSNYLDKKTVTRLVLEMIVIFIGVYLAFLMENYRENQADDAKRVRICRALYEEIDIYIRGSKNQIAFLSSAMANWDRQYKAGERPDPIYLYIRGNNRIPHHIWDSTVASGNLNLLDIKTQSNVSQYYQELKALLRKFEKSLDYSIAAVVPHLNNTPYFYQEEKAVLKPPFDHYMNRFRDLIKMAVNLRTAAKGAQQQLKRFF